MTENIAPSDFRQEIAAHIKEKTFYENICSAYDVLSEVRDRYYGHGITLVVRPTAQPSYLDDLLEEAPPFNGKVWKIDEEGIVDALQRKREEELATVIDETGTIVAKNVELLVDTPAFKRRYGITSTLSEYLGRPADDPPGARVRSAINASGVIGDSDETKLFILTLSKSKEGFKKSGIAAYYDGAVLYADKESGIRPTSRQYLVQVPKEHGQRSCA